MPHIHTDSGSGDKLHNLVSYWIKINILKLNKCNKYI